MNNPFGNSGFGNSGFGNSGFGNSGFGNNNQYGNSPFGNNGFGNNGFGNNNQYGNSPFGNYDETDQAILEAYDDMDIEEEGFGGLTSLPNQQPRRTLEFNPVVRNMSNRNDDSVMSLDEQQKRIDKQREMLIDRGLNPRDVYRTNQFGQNATNHGYSGSTYRDVVYDSNGNIVNNDPYRQWTPKGYKEHALRDLGRNRNLVRSAAHVYDQNIEWINQGRVTRNNPMVINGQERTVGDFLDMYEEARDSIPPPRPYTLGGKKSKKNRKTKGKKKQRRKTNKHRKKLKK